MFSVILTVCININSSFYCDAMNDEIILYKRLEILKDRHRELDESIDQVSGGVLTDQLQLHRLKKERLALRDQISRLEDQLYPDIIA